jgi:hypothetical protein
MWQGAQFCSTAGALADPFPGMYRCRTDGKNRSCSSLKSSTMRQSSECPAFFRITAHALG